MKLVECLLFYNELDMLYYHLLLMYPYVNHFVISESTHTFRGNPKESLYLQNKARFAPFQDKIVHVLLDEEPNADPWENERAQRLKFAPALHSLNLQPSDFVFILDVDEFISPIYMSMLRQKGVDPRLQRTWHVPVDMYYYTLESRIPALWRYTVMTTYWLFLSAHRADGHQMRMDMIQHKYPELTAQMLGLDADLPNGWHLSYWGDVAWIQNKLREFSHAEYSGETFTNPATIENHKRAGTNMFTGEALQQAPITTNRRLPPALILDTSIWFPYQPPADGPQ